MRKIFYSILTLSVMIVFASCQDEVMKLVSVLHCLKMEYRHVQLMDILL